MTTINSAFRYLVKGCTLNIIIHEHDEIPIFVQNMAIYEYIETCFGWVLMDNSFWKFIFVNKINV